MSQEESGEDKAAIEAETQGLALPSQQTSATGSLPDSGRGGVGRPRRAGSVGQKRAYRRHGFYRLRAALKELGGRAFDKRTRVGRATAELRAGMLRDLADANGDVSAMQEMLVDACCRQQLLIHSLDAWLFEQRTFLHGRGGKKQVAQVVRDRQMLVDGLARYLGQLGLEKRGPDLGWEGSALARHLREPAAEHGANNRVYD